MTPSACGSAERPLLACISFTERGHALARRVRDGLEGASWRVELARGGGEGHVALDAWAADAWARADALLFAGAAGIAVRAVAPHVASKLSDPAVICADEAGAHVVPLLSGHVGGANRLARRIAEVVGGTPVLTTATDVRGLWAPDAWAAEQGLLMANPHRAKDVARRLLEGAPVRVFSDVPIAGEVPELVEMAQAPEGADVVVSARACADEHALWLVPRCAVVGVGCRRGAGEGQVEAAWRHALEVLGAAAPDERAVAGVATIDLKASEPGLLAFCERHGWDLRTYDAEELAAVPGTFAGSEFVRQVTGVDGVCERAAAASGGELVLGKTAWDGVTVAIALRAPRLVWPAASESAGQGRDGRPDAIALACAPARCGRVPGRLSVVGLGPGDVDDMTGRARARVESADVIAGYARYVEGIADLVAGRPTIATGMRHEVERCRAALARAQQGADVALVCSGDAGVFGMAGLVLELAGEYPGVHVEVVPGVTAAQSASALLGAPLGHDFACISLSDALTSWGVIERRLAAAAQADLCLALYNPRSHARPDTLSRAAAVLLGAGKPAATACGWARNVGRAGEGWGTCTLGELGALDADMFTTVVVGNADTRLVGDRLVTPRGYRGVGA